MCLPSSLQVVEPVEGGGSDFDAKALSGRFARSRDWAEKERP
jgi:hypothetical protein